MAKSFAGTFCFIVSATVAVWILVERLSPPETEPRLRRDVEFPAISTTDPHAIASVTSGVDDASSMRSDPPEPAQESLNHTSPRVPVQEQKTRRAKQALTDGRRVAAKHKLVLSEPAQLPDMSVDDIVSVHDEWVEKKREIDKVKLSIVDAISEAKFARQEYELVQTAGNAPPHLSADELASWIAGGRRTLERLGLARRWSIGARQTLSWWFASMRTQIIAFKHASTCLTRPT